MKKHTLIVLLLVVIIGFGAFLIVGANKASAPSVPNSKKTSQSSTTPTPEQVATTDCDTSDAPTITYDNGAFSPLCVTAQSGTTITWVNKSADEVKLGADPHPSHTGNNEVTNGEFTLDIASGKQVTSKVTTAGTHGFHDHLNPSATGKIIVK